MHKFGLFFSLSLLLFAACSPCLSTGNKSQSVKPVVAQLKEAFSTQRDENSNVDSPALWQGPDGQNWLLATAKEGNLISVYDASTGKFISQFGKPGSALGEFSRPNGIAVIDNYAIIVERDNHRVQVFSLPDLKPIGVFGDSVLRYPYGLAVDKVDGTYNIYITDNYETADGETPPAYNLGQRVHQYKLSIVNNQLSAVHQKAFGDTVGEGVLYTVESILIDRVHNRLLIADEHEEHRNIKIYDLNGTFTGQTIPHTYFFYEPEGIVVWECKADSSEIGRAHV